MRLYLVLLSILSFSQVCLAQELDIKQRIDKINSLLPSLNTNQNNTDIISQSQLLMTEPGVLKFTTSNARKGKVYDQSEFSIIVDELDKQKLTVKKIECCNMLELYCKDRSFDCVDYVDRTSKQVKPVPYILMNKSWKENQHIIFHLERLIEDIQGEKSGKRSGTKKREVVKLYKNGGVYLLNLKLGDKPVTAILDSGASVVSISKEIEKELIKERVITKKDYITPAKYRIANGDILSAKRVVLPTLSVGNMNMKNVICSIVDDSSAVLLGKSFLDQFSKWTIDNKKQTLTLER